MSAFGGGPSCGRWICTNCSARCCTCSRAAVNGDVAGRVSQNGAPCIPTSRSERVRRFSQCAQPPLLARRAMVCAEVIKYQEDFASSLLHQSLEELDQPQMMKVPIDASVLSRPRHRPPEPHRLRAAGYTAPSLRSKTASAKPVIRSRLAIASQWPSPLPQFLK